MDILNNINIYPEAVILFIAFLLNIIIALIVLWKNYKSLVNKVFALMILCFAFWNFTSLMSDWVDSILQNPDKLLFWAKLTIVGPIVAIFLFLYFSFIFPKREKFNIWVILSFIPALILLCLTPFSLNIKEVYFSQDLGAFQTKIGALYDWFLVYCVLYLGLGIYNLVKKYKKLSGIYKAQVLYIIVGILIVGLVGVSFNIILPILGFNELIIYGPLSTLIFSGIVAYAITRYRLMNIKIVLKKSFVYGLALILLLATVIFLSILIQFILQKYFSLDSYVAAVVVITLVVFFLPKVKRRFEEKFDSIFKKDYIDLAKKFKEIEDKTKLISELRLDGFCKELSAEMLRIFKLSKIEFFIFNSEKKIWDDYNSQDKKEFIKGNDSLIKLLQKSDGVLIREELRYVFEKLDKDEKFLQFSKKELSRLIVEMEKRALNFVIPLIKDSKLVGFIRGGVDGELNLSKEEAEVLDYVQKKTVIVLKGLIS